MDIIQFLTDSATGVSNMIVTIFTNLSSAFWTFSEAGKLSIQPLGQIAILGAVVGVVWKGFNLLKGFIKLK